ncbi:TIM barrel protein [Paenibacillus faecalis]|uniref:TIM barrel protein n=1 Tax=Paenibacillus faecalis TaxID=2079532 RepID=UPI000D10BD22|nr:TIM barrel protein [Paenibacillus faecalis]
MVFGICQKTKMDWIHFIRSNSHYPHLELFANNYTDDSFMFDHDYLEQVRAESIENNLTLSIHAIQGINLGEKVERIHKVSRDIVYETLVCGEEIGAKWVTVHLGSAGLSNIDKNKKYKRLDLAINALEEILSATSNMKINIAIENLVRLPPNYGKSRLFDCVEEFEYIFNKLNSERLKVIFDIGHARISSKETENDMSMFIQEIYKHICAYHVHWNNGFEDTHSPLNNESIKEIARFKHFIADDQPLLFECYEQRENEISMKLLNELMIQTR